MVFNIHSADGVHLVANSMGNALNNTHIHTVGSQFQLTLKVVWG